MKTPLDELVEAAEAAVLVMPEHPDCQGKEACLTGSDDDRCCAGEATRLVNAVIGVKRHRARGLDVARAVVDDPLGLRDGPTEIRLLHEGA